MVSASGLRWLVALTILGLVIPILLYLISGTIIGQLVPCNPATGFTIVTSQETPTVLSCALVRVTVKLAITLWGSAIMLFGIVFLGVTELRGSERTS